MGTYMQIRCEAGGYPYSSLGYYKAWFLYKKTINLSSSSCVSSDSGLFTDKLLSGFDEPLGHREGGVDSGTLTVSVTESLLFLWPAPRFWCVLQKVTGA